MVHPEHLQEGLHPHFTPEKYFYSESPTGANKVVDVTLNMRTKLDALSEHKTQVTFMVDEVKHQASQAGLNLEHLLGTAFEDPNLAIAWALKEAARQVGQTIGVEYGEAFRYVRFHPLVESLLIQT